LGGLRTHRDEGRKDGDEDGALLGKGRLRVADHPLIQGKKRTADVHSAVLFSGCTPTAAERLPLSLPYPATKKEMLHFSDALFLVSLRPVRFLRQSGKRSKASKQSSFFERLFIISMIPLFECLQTVNNHSLFY
jgi:hypothetical protein